jgi:hypothetical protein
VAEVYPSCDVDLAPPVLSIGAGYENPDTNGEYQLTWTRPVGAVGPDVLQVATSCGPTFSDDASTPLVGGSNSQWSGSPQWITSPNPDDGGNLAYYIADGAAQDESLTLVNPIPIPAGYSSTLTFTTRQGLEAGFDFGHVEVSTNGGGTFKTMASYSGPGELPNEVFNGVRSVDLSEFAGQSIIIRFRLESDSFNIGQPAGWHIDNIQVTNSDWTDVVTTSGTSFVDHKASGTYCYRARTTFLVGSTQLASDFSNVVSVTVAPGVRPVVSRKMHGAPGIFDLLLPATGSPGIECRTGGVSGNHQVVFFFAGPVTVSNATVTPGSGATAERDGSGPPSISPNGREVTVNLKNVSNAQTLTVNLLGVVEGGPPKTVSVSMGVLAGDTTGNRAVNSSDIAQTQSQSGQAVSSSNFREDVTVTGSINSSDISFVQSKSGTGLP